MPEEKYITFYDQRRKRIILQLLNIVKENEGITIEEFVAKVHVNPPFCSNESSAKHLKDLTTDGKIKIDKDSKIFLCH